MTTPAVAQLSESKRKEIIGALINQRGMSREKAVRTATEIAGKKGFAEEILVAATANGEMHSGKCCLFKVDGDETDRDFGGKSLDEMVANHGPSGRIKQIFGEEITAPWRLGHEDDGELEEAFREAADLDRTDVPALAHTGPVWRANADGSRNPDGMELWGEFDHMPDPVRNLTDSLYPWRSAEIVRDYRGLGAALVGVGMIGARRPAKKNMPPIVYNSEDGEKQAKVVPMKPAKSKVKFAGSKWSQFAEHADDGTEHAEPTPLGMLILDRAKTMAANSTATMDEVMAQIMEAVKMDSAQFQMVMMGQGEPITDQQLMAIANALGMELEELQVAMGAAPEPDAVLEDEDDEEEDDDEEVALMSDKKKKGKGKGDAKPADKPTAITMTPEQFAEYQTAKTERDSLKEEFSDLTKKVDAHEKRTAVSERKAAAAELETWAQRELFSEGRVTGDAKVIVMHALRSAPTGKGLQVEAFSENEDSLSLLKTVLKAVTVPKSSGRGRPLASQPHEGATDKASRVVAMFVDKVKSNPGTRVKMETFAEGARCTPEETEKAVKLCIETPGLGKGRTLQG